MELQVEFRGIDTDHPDMERVKEIAAYGDDVKVSDTDGGKLLTGMTARRFAPIYNQLHGELGARCRTSGTGPTITNEPAKITLDYSL